MHTQRSQAMCTSALPASTTPVNQKINHLNTGVPKLSLVMYPFSISRDEHVPLKCFMAKKAKEKIYLPISLQ